MMNELPAVLWNLLLHKNQQSPQHGTFMRKNRGKKRLRNTPSLCTMLTHECAVISEPTAGAQDNQKE